MERYAIGANWKMQKPLISESVLEAERMVSALSEYNDVDIFIAPSHNTLSAVGKILEESNVRLASQNMHDAKRGAFTGEVSIEALLEVGCEYVLLGHSERRRIFGEDDNYINRKVLTAIDNDLQIVLCIGETAAERNQGKMKEVIEKQLELSLCDVINSDQIIIAYEPVWAINSPALNPGIEIRPATVPEAIQSHEIVRSWLISRFGQRGNNIPIQYGGSMKESNAKELLSQDNIDGGLVGGASLKIDTFLPIVQAVQVS